MRAFLVLCVLVAAGCPDVSHTVNVSPSAEPKIEEIQAAVERLYIASGVRFELRVVDSSERRDGEIIVRLVEAFPDDDPDDGWHQAGYTRATRKGVIVELLPEADERSIAHELVHAAGVRGHPTDDPEYLMSPKGTGWLLDGPTIQQMR